MSLSRLPKILPPGFESEHLKILMVQMCSSVDLNENLNWLIETLESDLQKGHADLIVLPEASLSIGAQAFPAQTVTQGWKGWDALVGLCSRHNTVLHMGSVVLQCSELKPFNASVLVSSAGIDILYKKLFLFELETPKLRVCESDSMISGQSWPKPFKIGQWSFGQSICFDLRFSQLFWKQAVLGVDAFLVPSAFFQLTGRAHWKTLLKARAIENQSYVLGVGQVGAHKISKSVVRKSYGHSMAIDPWGVVLENLEGQDAKTCRVVLDKALIAKVRSKVPMEKQMHLAEKLC